MRRFMETDDERAQEILPVLAAFGVASAWRQTFAYPLSLVTPGVRNWVDRESEQMIVAQRLKRMSQIIDKLHRLPTMRLSQMEDIAGCRAVLASNAEVEAVAARIEDKWDVRDRPDYREHGKPGTGYRALHYVIVRRERLVEVQLRTNRQHRWAEAVERTAARLGHNLKDGQGPPELVEYFLLASHVLAAEDRGEEVDEGVVAEFLKTREQVREYFGPEPAE